MAGAWVTIVETKAYLAQAVRLMTQRERDEAVEMIARNPECGDVLVGTGGIRKVRFATGHRGKSGSVRLVYYFCKSTFPIFLLAVFGKGEKVNLTKAERNELAKLASTITRTYGV